MSKKEPRFNKRPTKRYPTIAACGLDCGLCPRFYTGGPSKCPGCAGPGFYDKHPTCSFITCCVKNHGFEVCAECAEFPCAKFKSAREYERMKASSSYPSPRKILPNQYFIKKHGIKRFLAQQKKRIKLLETMIEKFDDGRSRSFFCRAALVYNSAALASSVARATRVLKAERIRQSDKKRRAKVLRTMINEIPLAGSRE